MHVEVVRRGGIAGVALRATLETAELGADVRAPVEAAFAALPFDRPAEPPAHPDTFSYDITVHDGAAVRTATIGEAQLPPELRDLVAAAVRRQA